MRAVLLLLIGCSAAPEDEDCGAASGLVVTTSDFTVGALATVSGAGRLQDRIATVSGDGIAVGGDGVLWQLNRGSADTVRRYAPGELCAPDWERALEQGANPHDALQVGEELWVSTYDADGIVRLDAANGERVDRIDLGGLADADGQSEPSDLLQSGESVLLALHDFDRRVAPWSSTGGRVVVLGRDGTVAQIWEVGPSPRLFGHPDGVLLLTGTYGALDGALEWLDPDTGSRELLLDEAVLGRDLESLAVLGDRVVLTAADLLLFEADPSEPALAALYCLDLGTGELSDGPTDPGWFVDVAPVGELAWVAVRRGWGPPGTPGLLAVDPVACAAARDPVETALEPYSLTSFDDS